MTAIPIGALVEIRYSDGQFSDEGYYLGRCGEGAVVYCTDPHTRSHHPICSFKPEFVNLKGSRAIRPIPDVRISLMDRIFGKKSSDGLPPGHEYFNRDVPVIMANESDWTNNFVRGQKIRVTGGGGHTDTCTVLCEFRNWVAFTWPVGSLDCRHIDELQQNGKLANSPHKLTTMMHQIGLAVDRYRADPNMLRNSIQEIERIMK